MSVRDTPLRGPSPEPPSPHPALVFPLRVLRFTFEETGPIPPAAIWRSALGPVLREAVCVTRMRICEPCPLLSHCVWPPFYLSRSDPARASPPLGVSPEIPPPYALVADEGPSGPELELRLFGEWAASLAPLLASSLLEAGARGLGRHRVPFVPRAIEEIDGPAGWRAWEAGEAAGSGPPPPPACPPAVEVRVRGALRLERDHRPLSPDDFRARDFAVAALRRLALLAWAHGPPTPVEIPLEDADRLVLLEADLHRVRERRYSARQGRSHPLEGLGGRFRLAGPGLPVLWPWLWRGQWTGVGKACTQGLGAYRLAVSVPASLPKGELRPSGGHTGGPRPGEAGRIP